MRRTNFTIVHTHTAKPDLYGTLAARLAGVPIVVTTLHGFYFHDLMPAHWRQFYMNLARIGMRFADVVLSQNPEDIETAEREKICPPDKIKFLGNGIDLQRFDPAQVNRTVLAKKRCELGLPENTPVVGFVGRLVADKGIYELMQAVRLIRQHLPGVRVLLVGPIDRAKRDALTSDIATAYGLEDACVFTGLRQDLPDLYALMNVFILPSRREAFPRAPMEASAMGIPSVATNVRGCRTVVKEGRNGFLVPLDNIQALAQAALKLLQTPELAARMGQEGISIAREQFDERTVFDKVKEEYSRLLTKKGLPVPLPPTQSAPATLSVST